MSHTFTGKDEFQREFVKIFDSLTGKYSPWEVWKDVVWCIAIAISNSVDARYRDSRENTYMSIISKYKKQEVGKFGQLFSLIHKNIIDKTEFGHYGDFLGEIFMALDLGNDAGGQFFTPYCICQLMAEMTVEENKVKANASLEKQGYISCNDCACGAGATLIAVAEACVNKGINYPFQVMFTAQDIDSTTALMCYIQLSLLGCAGYVVIGDTMSAPMTGHVLFGENTERCWYTPMFFAEIWNQRREIEIDRRRFMRMVSVLNVPLKDTSEMLEPDEHAATDQIEPPEQMPVFAEEVPTMRSGDNGDLKAQKRTNRKRNDIIDGQITFQF